VVAASVSLHGTRPWPLKWSTLNGVQVCNSNLSATERRISVGGLPTTTVIVYIYLGGVQ
jgi:hypothetical protein